MQRVFLRFNVWLVSLAAVIGAVDRRYTSIRVVQADSLVHYNMLLAWLRHGASPRGFTLTPSPYFIDMVVQLPVLWLAPDMESFSYWLACAYAILIFAGVYAVLRVGLACGPLIAAATAAAAMVGSYTLAPQSVIVHAFIVNHTSEVFTTLGMLALVHAWFAPGARHRRYAPALYVLSVAACVTSSSFFIATYCVPSAIAAVGLIGAGSVDRRRLAWFLGLGVIGALVGLVSIAAISRYAWPVRVDRYMGALRSYHVFHHTVHVEPGRRRAVWAVLVAAIGSLALAVVGRRRRWNAGRMFLLAFFPAAVITCTGMPIARGAFDGGYAFRYVQLPWLLAMMFYASVLAHGAIAIVAKIARPRPSWLPWSSAVLGIIGVAVIATRGGALTMYDAASLTSPTVRCVQDAERNAGLQDGLSTWWFARYVNAARHASAWRSPYVVVQLLTTVPPIVDPRDNDLEWFDGSYRGGATLNFLSTDGLDDAALQFFRDRIGPPDQIVTCPAPRNYRPDPKPTFELWIYDHRDAQERLAEFVTRGNVTSRFAPIVPTKQVSVDLEWAAFRSYPFDSGLVGTHRVWHAGDGDRVLRVEPMYLPSGRYSFDVELSTISQVAGGEGVAQIVIWQDNNGELARSVVTVGEKHARVTLDVHQHGGSTSGDLIVIDVVPGTAESIDVSAIVVTQLEAAGISPFQMFR
jgi:hypothetical protein